VNAGVEAFDEFTTDIRLPQSIVSAQTSRYGFTGSYKMFDDNSVAVIFSHRFLAAMMVTSPIVQPMCEEGLSERIETLANCGHTTVMITRVRSRHPKSIAGGGQQVGNWFRALST